MRSNYFWIQLGQNYDFIPDRLRHFANQDLVVIGTIHVMVISLTMYLSAEYRRFNLRTNIGLENQIKEYLEMNSDTATLSSAVAHFGYHPVYISRVLSHKTGKDFPELILKSRMRKAKMLLGL